MRSMGGARMALFLVVGTLLSACEHPGCAATTLTVQPASAVDLREPSASGLLKAKLSTADGAVAGKRVRFWIEHREFIRAGERLLDPVGAVETGLSGVARANLRERGYRDLVRDMYSDRYGAAFRGDAEFCASYGTAPFVPVRGVPEDAPRNTPPTPAADYFDPPPSP